MFGEKTKVVGLISGLGSYLSKMLDSKSKKSQIFLRLCKFSFSKISKIWIQNPEDIRRLVESGLIPENKCILGFGSGIEPIDDEQCEKLITSIINKKKDEVEKPYIRMSTRAIEEKGIRK